jgi:hypothetical protein
MIKHITSFLAALIAAPALAADKPVEVMVLGSYHFGNPGMDVNNVQVDTVLTPDKQKQLEAVAKALLTFKPTRIMVEAESDAPDFAMLDYSGFTPDKLKIIPNEREQIGYRIAKMAGLSIVHGIDEQTGAGEPDYFPFSEMQTTAKRLYQTDIITKANAPVKASLAKFEVEQKTKTVAEMLMSVNIDPIYTNIATSYAYLKIGDKDAQSGADLNAMYYLRNAKIFSKLMMVAKPGDRVLVVYGSGHNYWLRHFASNVPGYRFVDPLPYLKRAATQSR